MKTILLISLLLIVSCSKKGIETKKTNNSDINVELLFNHRGCSVYRFKDAARNRYYTDCNGSMQWSESCGKNCTRDVGID